MPIFNIKSDLVFNFSIFEKESEGSETGLKKLQSEKFTGFSKFLVYHFQSNPRVNLSTHSAKS